MRNTILAVTVLLLTSSAWAADPNFCGQYAETAVNQVRAGYSNPNCAARLQGARWSQDFNIHYDWCLHTSYQAANNERSARSGFLEGCR